MSTLAVDLFIQYTFMIFYFRRKLIDFFTRIVLKGVVFKTIKHIIQTV